MGGLDTATLLLIAAIIVGIAALWWIASQTTKKRAIEPREDQTPASVEKPAAVLKPTFTSTPRPTADSAVAAVAPPLLPTSTAGNITTIGIPAAIGEANNLLLLKGVGPKLVTLLTGLGVSRFDQIAGWGPSEIDTVDAHLGAFQGRIRRDNWIEQAGYLARGDIAAFEAKFGKLDGPFA